ncbi:MAG: MATE family efflux transporter, partial [Firmicutes bacterium]|nr:MATE family efflux transporter [Candidatus Colimorpha enterica]
MTKNKEALFEDYSIPRAVAILAIPSVLSTLVMVLYNIADSFFVGQLNDTVQSAAVTLASPVLLAFNAVNNLFGVGAASMMSRCLGKKDYDSVKRTASFAFWLSVISAAFISVMSIVLKNPLLGLLGADETNALVTNDYLFYTVTLGAIPAILNVVLANMVRSEGESFHAGVGVISGCVLNIILDPFFILPQFLGMGAAGAGLATFIANCFAMGYLLVVIIIRKGRTNISLDPRLFSFRRDIVSEVFGVGVPAAIQNLLNVTGQIILNQRTAAFGDSAVAAMGYAHKVNLLPLYITMGVTQGVMPLISYNFSSGNRKRMKGVINFVLVFTLIATVVLGGMLYVFAGDVIRLFIDVDNVVEIGRELLKAMSIGIPFLAIDFLAVAVFQAIGKGLYSLIFAVSRKIVLEIPAIIILDKL